MVDRSRTNPERVLSSVALQYAEDDEVAPIARQDDSGSSADVARADHTHDGAALPGVEFVTSADSPFTILPTHDMLVVDTTSGPVQLNLHAPAGAGRAGPLIIDQKGTFGTNAVTLHRAGSEKINNVAADKVLDDNNYRGAVITDGVDWYTP